MTKAKLSLQYTYSKYALLSKLLTKNILMLIINYLKMNKNEKFYCPVDFAFKRVGGKYKGRILWYLNYNQLLRYGELKRTLADITPKMLTQTLRELEEDGLVHRKVYPEVPPKVEYSLTEVGQELIPLIRHLAVWGQSQLEKLNIKTEECVEQTLT